MPISQLSPASLAVNNPYVNPAARTSETVVAGLPQDNQDAQKTAKTLKSDTVTISPQALQMIAGGNENKPEEVKENKPSARGGVAKGTTSIMA